ncbi:MAG: hypothetical protein JNM56_26590 [Planctomycetia bacterium]|nr:hypothetical protein [Planctomycetia bacterium]
MSNSPASDPNETALVQWANRQLGLDEHAAPDSVRAAVRERLAEDDFLPSLRRQHAVQLLCRADRPKVLPPVALEDEEQRLREEIDDFAAEFFQQDCLVRRRRWRELQRQCQPFPPLAARLAALEPGLNVPGVDELPPEPDTRELAEHLQALFVTRPAVRPGLRRMLLGKLEPEIDRWSAAAVHLREREPPLAALDGRFLDQLAHWKQNKKLQQKGRRQRIATPVESSSGSGGGGSSGGGQYGWVVVLVVVALLRILASGVGSSNRGSDPPARSVNSGMLSTQKTQEILKLLVVQSDVLTELRTAPPDRLPDAAQLRDEISAAYSSALTMDEWQFLLSVVKAPARLDDPLDRSRYERIREKLKGRG